MLENRKAILIVDDEDEIRENLLDFIEFKGFDAHEAYNGRDALEKLALCKPDLIISDLMMPEMGGMEFLKALQEQGIDIPVVIMTAFGTVQYAIDAMKNGAVDFLTKPIDLPYTLKVIDRVLRRSELERKLKEHQQQLEDDLHHAALIQKCLLPAPIETESLSFHYRFEPLIAIGGDYLTVHQYSDHKIAVALYDVSGHGVSAALTGSLINTQLLKAMEEDMPPSQTLDFLNQILLDRIGKTGMFITMIVAIIDTKMKTMTVCNAGHPDLLHWQKEKMAYQHIPSIIPPIGMIQRLLGETNEQTVTLSSGDRIVFYTDGFIEAKTPDGIMLTQRGFEDIVLTHIEKETQPFIQSIFNSLSDYHHGYPDDDMTLLAVDIK
jgi:serine phosphatase RsbU (regulator of sigma subunit)